MLQKLTDNEWGFSVEHDNPFLIFTYLQKIARESVGANNVIDLSRGDPGYGFTPSIRGRRFFSYLVLLDSYLNADGKRFIDYLEQDLDGIMVEIKNFTEHSFAEEAGKVFLQELEIFIDEVIKMSKGCGMEWSRFDVLSGIFRFCPVTGGSYLRPQGEEITRVVLADWYRKFIDTPICHDDLIVFQGASHAIGTLFKALGKAGVGYLNKDSLVVICSPAYAPYNSALLNQGVNTFALSVNPLNGKIDDEALEHLEKLEGKISAFILVDPNNPTGYMLDENTVERIANVAKKHDSIIISDEVYTSFFPKKKTIVDFAPERTLRIDARSKIERSTGIRFGDLLITKQANEHISKNILKEYLMEGQDFKTFMIQAKGPGGVEGELQHTTFVPGPSQFLGICHMVLGESERMMYFDSVKSNGEIFVSELGLSHVGNRYYLIFDLDEIEGSTKKDVPVEEKLTELAKRGIVFLPVYLFFSEYERAEKGSVSMVRASVVNTTTEKVRQAAQITKKYLTDTKRNVSPN